MTLRSKIIRLAHDHPEFRGDLLPLVKSAGQKQPLGPEYGVLDEDYLADLMEGRGVELKVGHAVAMSLDTAVDLFNKKLVHYTLDEDNLVHDQKTGRIYLLKLEPLNAWLK